MPVLTPADMPKPPPYEAAYMDNNGHIWLWRPDPPSSTGVWRAPGGMLIKPGNDVVMEGALKARGGVTELRRMRPIRRRE